MGRKEDTRRRAASGKLIGGHHGAFWSSGLKWIKRYHSKTQRRVWKQRIRGLHVRGSEDDARSLLNYRGT